jgi:predicted nucleic acid-binding protein
MIRYLLDTSALLAHYRQESGWDAVQAIFEDEEAEVIIASISLAEFGRRLRDLGAPQPLILETLTSYQLLCAEVAPVDTMMALAACTIGCHTSRRLPLVDALIAAVAQVRDAVLVHRDEHMRAIPIGLLRQHDLDLPGDPG